jgi:predicted TIM-barrel fold metal-dependent hydrolase
MALISVDDHIIEPPGVWQDRLPRKHREAGPRIVETDGGVQRWLYEGRIVVSSSGLGHSAGIELSERNREPQRFDQMRPGYYDPVARLVDMDANGVSMELNFPTWARAAGQTFSDAHDRELALLCVQAYNDFLLEEWCAAAPGRYIPLILLPIWDPALCVTEIERCVPRGARAIAFPSNPAPLGLPSFHTSHWDAVFTAAERAGLPLCSHFGTSGASPAIAPDAPVAVLTACFGVSMHNDLADLAMSTTLVRHPDLQIVYAESGAAWWPHALQRIDQVWESFRFYKTDPPLRVETRPSELIRSHVSACFIDDPLGVELRHKVGIDHMMWEADYPHADSLFPHSRDNAAEAFRDVPDGETRMMVHDNAARLFHL